MFLYLSYYSSSIFCVFHFLQWTGWESNSPTCRAGTHRQPWNMPAHYLLVAEAGLEPARANAQQIFLSHYVTIAMMMLMDFTVIIDTPFSTHHVVIWTVSLPYQNSCKIPLNALLRHNPITSYNTQSKQIVWMDASIFTFHIRLISSRLCYYFILTGHSFKDKFQLRYLPFSLYTIIRIIWPLSRLYSVFQKEE